MLDEIEKELGQALPGDLQKFVEKALRDGEGTDSASLASISGLVIQALMTSREV